MTGRGLGGAGRGMRADRFCLAIKAILAGPIGLRQLYLLHSRRGWHRAAIVDLYSENAREVARAVIKRCQRHSISSDFPVEVEDDLGIVYGFAGEDLVDMVTALCDECTRVLPYGPDFRCAQVRTVNGLIDYISRQPRESRSHDHF
jgi:hypothetical protein